MSQEQINKLPELRRLRMNGELTGGIIFNHPCFSCGDSASFGHGVSLLKFFRSIAVNKRDDSLLGQWTCGMSHCKVTGEVPQ